MSYDWLIVGLGNPGEKYAETRHNIGWLVCFELLKKYKVEPKAGKGAWYEAALKIERTEILVIFPTTFMNNSGEAVKPLCGQYKIHPSRVIAVVDELNFPVGKVHLKQGGSDGGHNGLKSLIYHLNTDAFWRLRCGIDRNFAQGEMADYVLSDFKSEEIETRNSMISRGVEAIEYIAKVGSTKAMSTINSDRELK
jgi:PTH1 family peptidyl-tRNA hydrolase